MQAALHQELGLAGANKLHRFFGCRLAVRDVDDLDSRDVEAKGFCEAANLLLRPDQDGSDHSRLGRFKRAAERSLVAGMRDGRRERGQSLCRRDEPLVLLMLAQLSDDGLLGHGAVLFSQAGAQSGGLAHHFRKSPTSPGMPPGKLTISA